MNFQIRPDVRLGREPTGIRLPDQVRRDLGILVGQFVQLTTKEELVLQVLPALSPRQETVLVSPETFSMIRQPNIGFRILEVTLGCDPEFFITHGEAYRQLMSAATYLPPEGEIGNDGLLGELRPHYGRHEKEVVRNLKQLIQQIPFRMKRMDWARSLPENGHSFNYEAHSYQYSIAAGFHVHLGIPPEVLSIRKDFNRITLNHLVKCLDWYVGTLLVPLEANSQRRTGYSKYGKPSDHRITNLTLEYRVPGAFYLRSPLLAGGLLGLVLLVAENVVSRLKVSSRDFIDLRKLREADLHEIMPVPSREEINKVLQNKCILPAQQAIYGIYKQLEALPSYDEHREGIENFISAVENNRIPRADLLLNWKERT